MTTHKLKAGDLVRICIIADTSYLEATLMELRRLYAARLRDLEYEYQRRVSAEAELERVEQMLMERSLPLDADADVTYPTLNLTPGEVTRQAVATWK